MPKSQSLPPCPDSPNCVSSQSQNPDQYVEPITYAGPVTEAKAKLRALFETQPRTRIIEDKDTYLHIEISSFLFRFIDDVECILDDEDKQIHIRSASRTGYWDLGVNRRRIEEIRTKFHEP